MPLNRRNVLTNIGWNFAGALVPLVVTLFTVPLYLHLVGAARYGVVLIAWSLLGYLGFLDFGISRATTNALARLAEPAQSQAARRTLASSFMINGCLGLVGGIGLFFGGSFLFEHVLTLTPDLRSEAAGAMIYIAPMLPCALMLGVGVGALEASNRFPLLNIIQTAGLILGQLLPLLAVWRYGPSLDVILPVMLGVRATTFVLISACAIRTVGLSRPRRSDADMLKALFGFGGWVTVSNLISPLMTTADQFVIGSVKEVAAVPFYAVPMNIVLRTTIIPTTVTRTLFPIFSRAEHAERNAIAEAALEHLCVVMTLVYIVAVFLCGPFLNLWLGREMMERSTTVFQLLCLGAWFNSLAFVLFSAIQGAGKPRIVAIIHSCEVVPYLALLWVLVDRFGIVGAALAWSVRAGIDAVLLARAFNLDRRVLRSLGPGFACVASAFVLARLGTESVWLTALSCALTCTVFLLLSAFCNDTLRTSIGRLRVRAQDGAPLLRRRP